MKKHFTLITSLVLFATFSSSLLAQQYKTLSDFPEHFKERKPFKRFAWDFTQRAFPYDTIPYTRAVRIFDEEIDRILKDETRQNSSLTWTSRGPKGVVGNYAYSNWGIISGRVRAIAIHPTDSLTVYIGAASGGLWKTTDGSSSWQDIGKGLGSLNYGAIAIDPFNTDIIYAGSGEAVFSLRASYYSGRGLFKSTDGGNTWEVITNGFGEFTHFADLVISPHDPNVLLAVLTASSYSLGFNLPNEGIWKSTDAGQTWVKTLDQTFACDVMFHPEDPNVVYATIGGQHEGSGFYISDDAGETWTLSNSGIPEPGNLQRMLFDISPSDPEKIYAVGYEPVNDKREPATYTNAYKSTDGGETWEQISEGVPLGGDWGGWYDQGWYDLCIAVDPVDSDHVYIGNVELHETIDGENYNPVRPYGYDARGSIVHVDYHKLVFDPSNANHLLIGCDGGIYKYDLEQDTAYSWNEGLETFQFYRMGSHPTNPDAMIAGSQDNGTMMTWDGEEAWTQVITGDGMECFFDKADPDNKIYASLYWGWLMKSDDGGNSFNTWKNLDDPSAWITPFFTSTAYDSVFYCANRDIYKYPHEYGPPVWQRITTDLSPVELLSLDQSSVNPNHMILAGFDEGQFHTGGIDTVPVKISTDGGSSWINVTANIPGEKRWIPRVLCDPVDENTMYILRNGFSEGNKVYKTIDLGETWINISGDLPDIPCLSMFVNPHYPNQIFVGTDLGVYISDDWGETYYYGGGDMPIVPIQDFEYVYIDGKGYLRMATYGRSVYETILLYTDTDEYYSKQNIAINSYPNPFSESLSIEYLLSETSSTRLSIYNKLGKELKVLVNEAQPAGNHKVTLDGSRLPAGVYFCVLKSGSGTQTKKLVKLE